MATYPTTLLQVEGSDDEDYDPKLIGRARDGSVKARLLQSGPKKIITVKHERLTAAQKSELRTFYLANRGLVFQFIWQADSQTYNVIFEGGIKWRPDKVLTWSCELRLIEV